MATDKIPSLSLNLLNSFSDHFVKIKEIGGVSVPSGYRDGKRIWSTWYGKEAINSFLNRFNQADREYIKKTARRVRRGETDGNKTSP